MSMFRGKRKRDFQNYFIHGTTSNDLKLMDYVGDYTFHNAIKFCEMYKFSAELGEISEGNYDTIHNEGDISLGRMFGVVYDFDKVLSSYTGSYSLFREQNTQSFMRFVLKCGYACPSVNIIVILLHRFFEFMEGTAEKNIRDIISNLREHSRQLLLIASNIKNEDNNSIYFDLNREPLLQQAAFTKLYSTNYMSNWQVEMLPQGNWQSAFEHELVPPHARLMGYDMEQERGIVPTNDEYRTSMSSQRGAQTRSVTAAGSEPAVMTWSQLSDYLFVKLRSAETFEIMLSKLGLAENIQNKADNFPNMRAGMFRDHTRKFIDMADITFEGKFAYYSPGFILHMFANRVENACVLTEERRQTMKASAQLMSKRADLIEEMLDKHINDPATFQPDPHPYPIMFLVEAKYEKYFYKINKEHRCPLSLPIGHRSEDVPHICSIATDAAHVEQLRAWTQHSNLQVEILTFDELKFHANHGK